MMCTLRLNHLESMNACRSANCGGRHGVWDVERLRSTLVCDHQCRVKQRRVVHCERWVAVF